MSLGATPPAPIAEMVFRLYVQSRAAHTNRDYGNRWRSEDEDCEKSDRRQDDTKARRAPRR